MKTRTNVGDIDDMNRALLSLAIVAAFVLGSHAAFLGGQVAASSTARPAQAISPVLVKLEEAGRNLKSLQAGITQHKEDRTLGVPEDSAGKLFYKAGAAGQERVLLQYTDPVPQTVSVIGDKVVIFQPRANQIFETTRKSSANKNRSLSFLGLAYSDAATQLRERYDITILGEEQVNGRPATLIALKPKVKEAGIAVQGMQLWIDHKTWLPVQYYVQDKASRTTITLTAMQPNVSLPDSTFEIAYPKGVTVQKG